jgi:hypothetical protein
MRRHDYSVDLFGGITGVNYIDDDRDHGCPADKPQVPRSGTNLDHLSARLRLSVS